MRARPSVLLYDWDNTLVDAWAGLTAALNDTFAAFGLPVWTVEDARRRVRVAMRESFPVLFGADRWEKAREHFLAAMAAGHLHHLAPLDGAAAALDAGSAWSQGVVSNKDGRFLRAEVGALGWGRYFGALVGAGDAAADKPDPAPVRLALARLGAPAGLGAWYLGDTALDMQAARAAGVTAVLVGDAAHDGGVGRAAPDLHFVDLRALETRLRELT